MHWIPYVTQQIRTIMIVKLHGMFPVLFALRLNKYLQHFVKTHDIDHLHHQASHKYDHDIFS